MRDLRVIAAGECSLTRSPDTVTGIRRLAQKAIIELLTEQGSMKYLPDRGCNFISRLKRCKTDFDVINAFTASKNQIRRNLKDTHLDKNERYANMSIEKVYIEDKRITLELIIRNLAGEAIRTSTPPIHLDK